MSSNLKRHEALNWNAYMDESLKLLCTRPEWDGDTILASQVKIQLLVQELAQASEHSGNRPSTGLLGSLRKRLHSIRADLPGKLQDHGMFISSQALLQAPPPHASTSCFIRPNSSIHKRRYQKPLQPTPHRPTSIINRQTSY